MSEFNILFTVKKVNYRIDANSIIMANNIICKNKRIKATLGQTMEIRGFIPMSIYEGDVFNSKVEKREDKKTGKPYLQIIDIPERYEDERTISLANFIKRRIKGVSVKKAQLIVELLGFDAIKKIAKDEKLLSKYPELGIKEAKSIAISNQMKEFDRFEDIAIIIQATGVGLNIATQLYETYGNQTDKVLFENPYRICYDGKLSFKIADKIAKDLEFDAHNQIRIKTAILDYMKHRNSSGDICILKKHLFGTGYDLNRHLKLKGEMKVRLTDDEILNALDELILDKKVILEDVNGTSFLYLPIMNVYENKIATTICNSLKNSYNKRFCDESDIINYLDKYETEYFPLDYKQKEAVKNTLLNKVSILTGGPGTGKTATVNVIVNCIIYISKNILNREPNYILLAPTGKAAERMTELTNQDASTIHRALGLKAYNSNSIIELEADFVIVDEGSMIDIELMEKLISSLGESTRLLIVGDTNQLPSVGPGMILRDFIESGVIKYVELTTVFRQAANSMIVQNAHKIINGLTSDMNNGIDLNNPNGNFLFIEENESILIKDRIIEKIKYLVDNGIYKFNQITILTATRQGDIGTEILNSILQETFNPYRGDDFEFKFNNVTFRVGDKVIQTKNDYDLSVFNGFIGEIIEINETIDKKTGLIKEIVVVYYESQDLKVEYDISNIESLELAYSLTIHKSQGSEFPVVISPFHKCQQSMLNRNLLYTAVTRAKDYFYTIGEEEAINSAIRKNMSKEDRLSRLSEKLNEKFHLLT